jgi:hypothetical protein
MSSFAQDDPTEKAAPAATTAPTAAAPVGVTGRLVAIDTTAKTIQLKVKSGVETLKYEESTKYEISKVTPISALAEGNRVKVYGVLAADESSILATGIDVVAFRGKFTSAIKAADKNISGILAKDGDQWVVTVNDKKVALKTTDKTSVKTRSEAKLEDMKPGKMARALYKKGAAEPTASRLQLRVE